jgi:hypothetical protein
VTVDAAARPAGPPPQEALGESAARLAVDAVVGGAGRPLAGGTPGAQACHGGVAGVIGVEDLGEEHPQGDERREQPVAEGDGFVAEGLLDGVVIEELGEGELGGVVELLAALLDLARAWGRRSMAPGWPP